MIQPNEIRIGVIVTVDNPKHHPKLKDVPLKVIGVEEKVIEGAITHSVRLEHINQKVNMFYETYSQFIKFIHPIPLTEEILLKCGFEEQELFEDHNPFFVLGSFSLSTDSFAKERFFYDCDIEIKYLHQLQNFYFVLTNQELEIEL